MFLCRKHVLQSRLSADFSMLFAQELRFPFNYTLHDRVHIMILSQYLHTSTDFLMMILDPHFFFSSSFLLVMKSSEKK